MLFIELFPFYRGDTSLVNLYTKFELMRLSIILISTESVVMD